jgi:endonuclease G
MVPQNPKLNRGLWARIEKTVRDLAERDGQVYVVTGPIFADSSVVPDGRVRVPSETFKAIDDPNGKILGAYVADNSADGKYEEVSVAKLGAMIGLDVFPELTLAKGSPTANLPTP